jgi:hypothetical protein
MGRYADFYGKLEFNRPLTDEELLTLNRILGAGRTSSPEIRQTITRNAEQRRAARGGGPLWFDAGTTAEIAASMQGFISGKGLSPDYAADLRITDDRSGLVHCSEKTYDMVAGVNFIIANARREIPAFGLKGYLFGKTEFEPYEWLVTINRDGRAEPMPCRLEALPLEEQREINEDKERRWRKREQSYRELKEKYGDDVEDEEEQEPPLRAGFLKRIWQKLGL